MKIDILSTEINESVSQPMVEYAKKYAPSVDVDINEVYLSPGSLELPYYANEILSSTSKPDGLLVLGVIRQGETKHGEVIGHQVTKSLIDIQIKYHFPIATAIIGPCSTIEHAQGKMKATAEKAVRALKSMINFKQSI